MSEHRARARKPHRCRSSAMAMPGEAPHDSAGRGMTLLGTATEGACSRLGPGTSARSGDQAEVPQPLQARSHVYVCCCRI